MRSLWRNFSKKKNPTFEFTLQKIKFRNFDLRICVDNSTRFDNFLYGCCAFIKIYQNIKYKKT